MNREEIEQETSKVLKSDYPVEQKVFYLECGILLLESIS